MHYALQTHIPHTAIDAWVHHVLGINRDPVSIRVADADKEAACG
jgi:hypothetical protein